MSNNCRICDKPIMFGGRKYCGDPCRKVAKQTSQRVIKQAKKLEIIKKGKECTRCHKFVHEPSMRKYCKECSEILQINHYSTYEKKPKKPKKEKVVKLKPCKRCEEPMPNAKGNRKWCEVCVKIIAKEKMVKQGKDRVKTRADQKVNKASGINPMYLERGVQSTASMTGVLG